MRKAPGPDYIGIEGVAERILCSQLWVLSCLFRSANVIGAVKSAASCADLTAGRTVPGCAGHAWHVRKPPRKEVWSVRPRDQFFRRRLQIGDTCVSPS